MSAYPLMTRNDRAQRAERVAERYAQGIHPLQVAQEFGISRCWVNKIARLHGVNRPQGPAGRVPLRQGEEA